MTNFTMPLKVYLTATDFPTNGVGSGGDITPNRDAAYDQFAECVADGQPTRVFMLEFHPDTNNPDFWSEITEEMQAEYDAICEARGIAAE